MADTIKGKSTNDILEDFLAEAESGGDTNAAYGTAHVLLCLDASAVRTEIRTVIEADETLTALSPDGVSDEWLTGASYELVVANEVVKAGLHQEPLTSSTIHRGLIVALPGPDEDHNPETAASLAASIPSMSSHARTATGVSRPDRVLRPRNRSYF